MATQWHIADGETGGHCENGTPSPGKPAMFWSESPRYGEINDGGTDVIINDSSEQFSCPILNITTDVPVQALTNDLHWPFNDLLTTQNGISGAEASPYPENADLVPLDMPAEPNVFLCDSRMQDTRSDLFPFIDTVHDFGLEQELNRSPRQQARGGEVGEAGEGNDWALHALTLSHLKAGESKNNDFWPLPNIKDLKTEQERDAQPDDYEREYGQHEYVPPWYVEREHAQRGYRKTGDTALPQPPLFVPPLFVPPRLAAASDPPTQTLVEGAMSKVPTRGFEERKHVAAGGTEFRLSVAEMDNDFMDVPIGHLGRARKMSRCGTAAKASAISKSTERNDSMPDWKIKKDAARVASATRAKNDEEFERLRKANELLPEDIHRLKPKKVRRAARFKNPSPSRFCHICCRPRKHVRFAVCAEIRSGVCRKVICEKCFAEFGLGDFESATDTGTKSWLCTHCTHTCPRRAQCSTYTRVNGQVRLNRLMKSRKGTFNGGEAKRNHRRQSRSA